LAYDPGDDVRSNREIGCMKPGTFARRGRLPEGLRLRDPDMLAATGLGVGCAPYASGTFGSIVALPPAWLLASLGGPLLVAAAAALCFAVGVWASSRIVRRTGVKDPGFVVIDEIAAQLFVLALLPLGFLAFRAADIFKPFPANWCDRNIGGGLGVMLDDAVAGVQAGIAAWLLCRVLSIGDGGHGF
jgi:phosphatidylglycerophosphatase A